MDRWELQTRVFFLVACCASLFMGGCATADKSAVEMPIEAGMSVSNSPDPTVQTGVIKSPVKKLEGLETWELLGNNALIEEFYELKNTSTEMLDGLEVRITVREARFDEMMEIAIAPMTLVTVSSSGFEVRQPLYPDRRVEFVYSLPKSSPRLLVINERCNCPDPYGDRLHLFTMYNGSIRPLGAVSGIEDADGDGMFEPFAYDLAFSNGMGLVEADKAPVIRFFFTLKRGDLISGNFKHAPFYGRQITRLSETITKDHAESPGSGDLVPILEKFLYYKAMGREKDGWKALEKDILLYGGQWFPQRRGVGGKPQKTSVEEIISRMRKALGRAWKER